VDSGVAARQPAQARKAISRKKSHTRHLNSAQRGKKEEEREDLIEGEGRRKVDGGGRILFPGLLYYQDMIGEGEVLSERYSSTPSARFLKRKKRKTYRW